MWAEAITRWKMADGTWRDFDRRGWEAFQKTAEYAAYLRRIECEEEERERELADKAVQQEIRHRLVNGINKVVLTAAEKRSFKIQTGVDVEDGNHAKRVLAAKGMRMLERGEADFDRTVANETWATKDGKQENCPSKDPNLKEFLRDPNKRPFDIQERYRYHHERLKHTRKSDE